LLRRDAGLAFLAGDVDLDQDLKIVARERAMTL
jgi:hypothetical protein